MGASDFSPLRFAGEYFVPELGLYYLRARFYDPQAGRFLTPDLVGIDRVRPQTYNPYLYADANPLRFVDPLGTSLVECMVVGAIIGILTSIASPIFDFVAMTVGKLLGDIIDVGSLGLDPVGFSISASASGGGNWSVGLKATFVRGDEEIPFISVLYMSIGFDVFSTEEHSLGLDTSIWSVMGGLVLGRAGQKPSDPGAELSVELSGTFVQGFIKNCGNPDWKLGKVVEWSKHAKSIEITLLSLKQQGLQIAPAIIIHGSFGSKFETPSYLNKMTEIEGFGNMLDLWALDKEGLSSHTAFGISFSLDLPILWVTLQDGKLSVDSYLW
jgi:RHS repeat-associated protein